MPRIIGKVEGRGNGIKTVIVNADSVAQALKRPTEQLTKYIALEFSALCYDLDGKQTINGKFETQDLQNHVQSYIKRFVLCPKCGNPETVQALRGKGKKQASIVLECKACGKESEADNLHKLKTLIVKELTEKISTTEKKSKEKASGDKKEGDEAGSDEVEGEAGEKKIKKEKKPKKDKTADKKEGDETVGSDGVEGDAPEKKVKKVKKPKKSKDEDGDAKTDKKKKKKKDKKKDGDDDEDDGTKKFTHAMDDPIFKQLAEEFTPVVAAEPIDESKVVSSMFSALKDKGLARDDIIHLVWSITVAKSAKPAAAIEKYSKLFNTASAEIGIDEGPSFVLSCVEETLIGKQGEDLERSIKLVPIMLKALFDHDVLDENHIIRWFAGELVPSSASVSKGLQDEALANRAKLQSKPLIDWLLADSSEDEEDEDDDDDSNSNSESNDSDSD